VRVGSGAAGSAGTAPHIRSAGSPAPPRNPGPAGPTRDPVSTPVAGRSSTGRAPRPGCGCLWSADASDRPWRPPRVRCPPACPLLAVSSVRVLAPPPAVLRRRTTWRRRRRRRWAPAMWVCPPRPSLHSRARGQVSMFLATSGWQRPRRHCRHALNMLSQQHVCIPASFRQECPGPSNPDKPADR